MPSQRRPEGRSAHWPRLGMGTDLDWASPVRRWLTAPNGLQELYGSRLAG